MRKAIVFILAVFLLLPVFADEITFSSNESSVRLREGMESVVLSGSATVSTGSLTISAENITLSGASWRYIECSGKVVITDSERDISIRTSVLWYDREAERLLISSYFEIEDRENEMSAMANHLEYDMSNEMLRLTSRVHFSKINGDDVIIGSSESLSYDRNNETLELSGSCHVIYNGDDYSAERISIDIENDRISMNSAIRGTING